MWNDLLRALRKVAGLFSAGDEDRAHPSTDSGMACAGAASARIEIVRIEGDAARVVGTVGFEFTTADERLFTPAKREEFKADVCQELTRLAQWAVDMNWVARAQPQLRVVVSDRYKISKSLVPAWSGRSGDMEFPVHRVVFREAAIAHELAHIFFPNGNRFLAEGLAVYVQAAIGSNPAFPNFGRTLHVLVRQLLATASADSSPDRICLEQVRLPDLDAIATPSRLALRIGEKEVGPTLTYPIAGSFVQFLIESHGIEKFRALYEETPFKPLARSAGAPERWMKAYYGALTDLEAEWKSTITRGVATAHPHAQLPPDVSPMSPNGVALDSGPSGLGEGRWGVSEV